MKLTKSIAPLMLAGALAVGGTATAEAKSPGKGKAMKTCMASKGVDRSDRGTAAFRDAHKACRAEVGGKNNRGGRGGKRGSRA